MIIPGRPTSRGITWWVFSQNGQQPQVSLSGPGAQSASRAIYRLGNPEDPLLAQRAFIVGVSGLQENSEYTLTTSSASAKARTLPERLKVREPFLIAVGSCYCLANDAGIASFNDIKHYGRDNPIRIRILCGDQIYMDLSSESGAPILFRSPDPWDRYNKQWISKRYLPFLGGQQSEAIHPPPTLMMADDHEFWNDYPHSNAWLLWSEPQPLWPLGRKMDRAFSVYQASLNLDPQILTSSQVSLESMLADEGRTFTIDLGGLEILFLDTRTQRTRYDDLVPRICGHAWLNKAIKWIRALQGPGVLVLSQPLVEKKSGWFARWAHTMPDINLPDYPKDFGVMWEAIFNAPHDILIDSGDIHRSRLFKVTHAQNHLRAVWEFIGSPLSRIHGSKPDHDHEKGKVEWENGGLAYWMRYGKFASNAASLYGTLTFEPQDEGPRSRIRTHAALWGLPGKMNLGPVRLQYQEFTLK